MCIDEGKNSSPHAQKSELAVTTGKKSVEKREVSGKPVRKKCESKRRTGVFFFLSIFSTANNSPCISQDSEQATVAALETIRF